jgi:hypothetical protein
MTNPYLEKLRSVGVMRGGTTKDRVTEGRDADTGTRWKATTDELNNTVTERTERAASGVSERQDVHLRPETVRYKLGES